MENHWSIKKFLAVLGLFAIVWFAISVALVFKYPDWYVVCFWMGLVLFALLTSMLRLPNMRWLFVVLFLAWMVLACPFGLKAQSTADKVTTREVVRIGFDEKRGEFDGEKQKTNKPQIDKATYPFYALGIPVGSFWFGRDEIARFNSESGSTRAELGARSFVLLPWPHFSSSPVAEINGDDALQTNTLKLVRQHNSFVITVKLAGGTADQPGQQTSYRLVWGFSENPLLYIGWFLIFFVFVLRPRSKEF